MKNIDIVDQIIASYEKHPLRKEHCDCALPSNQEVKKIITLTKKLIYPGYFEKKPMLFFSDKAVTNRILRQLKRVLSKQIELALLYVSKDSKRNEVKLQAAVCAESFLQAIPSVREAIVTDLEAHFEGDPAAFNRDEIIVSYPGMYAIMIYRIAHLLHQANVPMIPRMMTEFAHRETGIDIHPGAAIGKSFFIDHGTGVVIGETAVIGEHVKIYQGVTLGALSTKGGQNLIGKKRHPTIGDYVTIYAGASILGGDTVIGSGTTVGSNVFITESVKNSSKVSQIPPENRIRENANPVEKKESK